MISIMKEIDRLGCLLSTLPGTQLAPGRDPDPKRKKSNSWEKFLQQATLPDGKANRQVRGVSIIRADLGNFCLAFLVPRRVTSAPKCALAAFFKQRQELCRSIKTERIYVQEG